MALLLEVGLLLAMSLVSRDLPGCSRESTQRVSRPPERAPAVVHARTTMRFGAALGVARPPRARSVLVLSLRSAVHAQRCSNTSLAAQMFTAPDSLQSYFTENSYGRESISGMVSGPYTIDMGNTCALVEWADQADAAAAAAGIDVRSYDITVYVPPRTSTVLRCTPGRQTGKRIWLRDDTCDSKFNTAHELGHAFDAGHSGVESLNLVAQAASEVKTAAVQLEYNDLSSVMGGIFDGLVNPETERAMFNATPHFTAPQKVFLGWIPPSGVQAVTVTGTYPVAVLATATSEVQVLKVTTPSGATYYLSYRRQVGFDSSLLPLYVDKTSVHTAVKDADQTSTLHALLADGQSYSTGELTITQVRHDARHAYIRIAFR